MSICSNIDSCPFKDLTSKDIEIKENRNKVENMVNSANTYSTLRSAGLNDVTSLEVSRIVNDAQAVADMNKKEKEQQQKSSNTSVNNNTNNNNGSNSGNTDE